MTSKSAIMATLIVTGAIAASSLLRVAQAQSSLFRFAKVVDTDMLLPGAAGVYRGTESAPALEAGRVAFWTYGDHADGVYVGAPGGGLTLVADTTTLMPFTPVTFDGHDYVSLDGGRVVFLGWGQDANDNYYEGIYRFENGALNRIADLSLQVPGKTTNFLEVYGPASSGNGQVAFIGVDFDDVEDGVYIGGDGPLARVADTSTRVPGRAENFEYFYEVRANRDKVAFVADSESVTGVYLHDNATGALSRVVDTTMQVPGRADNFEAFGNGIDGLDVSGDAVAFIGLIGGDFRFESTAAYVFDAKTGVVTRAADSTMPVPGATGMFRDAFTAVSIDEGHIALGYGHEANSRPMPPIPQTPHFGVYTDLGGELHSLLRAGDMLDGKSVIRAYVGPDGLDGNQVAMTVEFVGGSQGIYIATLIPEPATLLLMGIASMVLLVAAWRRRRRSGAVWQVTSSL